MALIAMHLSACAVSTIYWPEETGRVIASVSYKPVHDAWVIVEYIGYALAWGHGGGSDCFVVKSAKTNSQGAFTIPAWKNYKPSRKMTNQYSFKLIYKAGYEMGPSAEGNYIIKPASSTVEDRMNYLLRLISDISCGNNEENWKNINLYKDIYKEAEILASNYKIKNEFGIPIIDVVRDSLVLFLHGSVGDTKVSNEYFERQLKDVFQ